MDPAEFAAKWANNTTTEKAAAHSRDELTADVSWTVWTDGSGTTGGPAGIGFYAECDPSEDAPSHPFTGSLPLRDATNQQAELLAAAFALHDLFELCGEPQDVTVVSDSEYLVRGWNEYPARRRKKNLAHWARLTCAAARHRSVVFKWTRAHVGTAGNEEADRLAGDARQQAIRGFRWPSENRMDSGLDRFASPS